MLLMVNRKFKIKGVRQSRVISCNSSLEKMAVSLIFKNQRKRID